MSILFDCPVKNSILVYLILAITILVNKPRFFFNKDGSMIPFGHKKTQNLLNYPVVLFISAVFITFFFEQLHLKKY